MNSVFKNVRIFWKFTPNLCYAYEKWAKCNLYGYTSGSLLQHRLYFSTVVVTQKVYQCGKDWYTLAKLVEGGDIFNY